MDEGRDPGRLFAGSATPGFGLAYRKPTAAGVDTVTYGLVVEELRARAPATHHDHRTTAWI
jgi:hypothetical protein